MEQYPIPQFIEQESKLAFFISFRQFFYLVGAGILCFFIYWSVPRFIFYVSSVIIFIAAVVLAFGTIGGTPILNYIMGSVGFSMGGKNYTWSKKESPYPFRPISRTQIKKIDKGPVLQAQTSQLKKTRTLIELKTK